METSFERSKNIYKAKVPEIEQTLEMIRAMVAKQEASEDMYSNYSLSDTLYTKAKVRFHCSFFVVVVSCLLFHASPLLY
jgi:hypothetical protein